jgi:hypothetical protein
MSENNWKWTNIDTSKIIDKSKSHKEMIEKVKLLPNYIAKLKLIRQTYKCSLEYAIWYLYYKEMEKLK